MAFVEDSLLRPNGLSHHGEAVTEDEELSPTLENVVVLTWLKLIHPSLPRLVKQRYGTELRSRTLASIKPEISQALCSLLDEIRASDDAKIFRTAITTEPRRPAQSSRAQSSTLRAPPRKPRQDKVCPLCKQAGRQDTRHFLSECAYLPDSDRRYIVKARQIVSVVEDESDTDDDPGVSTPTHDSDGGAAAPSAVAYRVQTRQSPYVDVFHGHHAVRITLDSGATGNMIRHSTATRLGSQILSSAQSVHQADGSSQLQVVGETRISFTRGDRVFQFDGLIVVDLDVDVLAGTPFMEANDVAVRPAKREVILGDVDPPFCNIRKFVGSQLRTASYRVRLSDCFKVPSDVSDEQCSPGPCLSDCSEDEDLLPEDGDLPPSSHPPPLPPAIPAAISAPVVVDVHLGAASCPPVCSVVPSEAGLVSGCVDVGRHTSPDLPEIAPSACQGPRRLSRHRRHPTYLRDFTRM
ncbi:hypothetical protein SKAU_G00318880 [Synaphobranchus kaupii]|uniref:Uncharacterized protein n=1 Tax=Synaphobranchus kaupii TaxID=118154 RepID=A0A9Q1IJW2_SYNKA|nr:hypothetical protein SKAU_G00318880 [Synaphobranchus kaupii]